MMKRIIVDNFVYPKTKFVECVLSGNCPGSPGILPRAEIIDVDKHLESIGITSAYRTSFGTVYVYNKELTFYFVDGRGPDENSIKVIESFVDEGFTRVKNVKPPIHLEFIIIDSKPFYYVEIKNNEYSLMGAVKHGKEVRHYSYKKVLDPYSGNISIQEIRFYPPDGEVEVKVESDFVNSWSDFLNEVKRLKKFSARSIIMKTFDLPGIVNTTRYPPYEGYDEILESVGEIERVGFDHMGPVIDVRTFVGKFILPVEKVVLHYPIKYTFENFEIPLSMIHGKMKEEEIVTTLLLR